MRDVRRGCGGDEVGRVEVEGLVGACRLVQFGSHLRQAVDDVRAQIGGRVEEVDDVLFASAVFEGFELGSILNLDIVRREQMSFAHHKDQTRNTAFNGAVVFHLGD